MDQSVRLRSVQANREKGWREGYVIMKKIEADKIIVELMLNKYGLDKIHIAQYRIQWRALVSKEMNRRVR
jgi:hypothetical protein